MEYLPHLAALPDEHPIAQSQHATLTFEAVLFNRPTNPRRVGKTLILRPAVFDTPNGDRRVEHGRKVLQSTVPNHSIPAS